ncbi:hypothetical protein TEA_005278 [Camellia sinensis var. sinensis]|uniref:Uncharacterized protein n=1 Tax=Camellia sinensis var. sinensis TaxID=542762 RepID=A0A4S4DV73_CAMSN|nr:hypothetical protein TEA_005278 [Camellia sinensis var. sinensis]
MEGDDGLRTTECLRGRLLAERAASRAAKEDAEQLGNKVSLSSLSLSLSLSHTHTRTHTHIYKVYKVCDFTYLSLLQLIELENQLRLETKSRNRAEKRLKFLIKKLESLNISYVSEDSEHSSMVEKSDMSSVSSSPSSSSSSPKTKITNTLKCDTEEESVAKMKCPAISQDLEDNVSQSTSTVVSNQGHCSAIEGSLSSSTERADCEEHSELGSIRNYNDLKTDDHSSSSLSKLEKENNSEENSEQAQDGDEVDNSLALVPAEFPKASSPPTDPHIVDERVKDVLEALRHAREKLQWTMERRHLIRVGSK